jgi:valacyclovir hydrolase
MPILRQDDFAIYYESTGQGDPLLLMPGALGTGTTDFPHQIPFFSKTHRVIAFDPRGYGRSRPPVRDYPPHFYERDADDALALMTALNLRRFSVLGWSDGANSGTILAARNPERVTQLVVWAGNSFLTEAELHIFQSMRSLSTWSERALEPMRAVYGSDLESLWESYVAGLERIYAAGGDLYRPLLSAVRCPTLILHGDKDPLVPAEHPEIIHRGIAGSELIRFAAGKHNIHARYYVEFNQKVASFLARTKATSTRAQ